MADISKQLEELLLSLRSRHGKEENLKIDSIPTSPQLPESRDVNRPEPKPSYVINATPDVTKASSPFSNRTIKRHQRISFEEIDKRRLNGLCLSCEEPETPDHYLRHKNLGILMIDGDEDQSCDDEELVEMEGVTESNGIEVNKQRQFQVPVSKLEHGLQIRKVSTTVCEDSQYIAGCDDSFDHQKSLLQVSHVKARGELLTKSIDVTNNQAAHYLFDKMPLRVQSKRRHSKCHKSWRFKFKHRVASRESKAGFEVNMKHNRSKEYPCLFFARNMATLGHILYDGEIKFNGCRMLIQLLLSVIHKKRQRKTPKYHKTWKFRFKNKDLQRVMTQLDTRHCIFRGDSECIPHLSTVVHHLETSHKQSSFAIDALQSDFGIESWMFKYKRDNEKQHTLAFSKNMRRVETSSNLLLLNGRDNPPPTATGFELDVGGTESLNQDGHKLCAENEGCLDCSQVLVLMKGITDSSQIVSKSENLRKMEVKSVWDNREAVGEVLFQHSHGLSNKLHRQDLQDLQQFITLGEVKFQIKHKWKFKGKGKEVREELSHLTSREAIQEDPCHYSLLVVADYLTTQMQFGGESNHVWHRWKARYSQNLDRRVWDPGG